MRRLRARTIQVRGRWGLRHALRDLVARDRELPYRPPGPWLATAAMAFDVVLFNVVTITLVRAVLFFSAGGIPRHQLDLWAVVFLTTVIVLDRLPTLDRPRNPVLVPAISLACVGLALLLVLSTRLFPRAGSDKDFSWLVTEMIKVPLWAKMFAQLSPGFVMFYAFTVLALMRWTAAAWRRWPLAAVAGAGCLAATVVLIRALSGTDNQSWFYWGLFASPLLAIALAGLAGWFRLAFRMTPPALYVLMVGLNYVAALPLVSPGDWLFGGDPGARCVARIPAARFFYKPDSGEAQTDFRFTRKLFRLGDRVVLAAGPMGATRILVFDADTGARLRSAQFGGLLRDLLPSPDGNEIWATNWSFSNLLVLDPTTLDVKGRRPLGPDGFLTPWAMRIGGDRLYMTNVTPPLFGEFALPPPSGALGATLTRAIDFHRIGYVPFTDGVYGLSVDPERGTALLTVGMLNGRYELGLVEVGLNDFAVRRDLRLRGGVTIFPIPGARRVLLTSYYDPVIFEVDLERWKLVRAIRAAPSIFHLAYDEARRLIYATSRAAGTLLAIDYDTGKVRRQDQLGNKTEPLLLDGDRLLVGSHFGVIEIDLSQYVGPPAPR